MWFALFGKKYIDMIGSNQIFIVTGFSWRGPEGGDINANPKEWVVRSASFNNTSGQQNLSIKHFNDNMYATYGKDDPTRYKRESEEFTNVIKNSLTKLINNGK